MEKLELKKDNVRELMKNFVKRTVINEELEINELMKNIIEKMEINKELGLEEEEIIEQVEELMKNLLIGLKK